MWIEILPGAEISASPPVTPLAGVWIEMGFCRMSVYLSLVTPLAGVWIEILEWIRTIALCVSLPLRECGLKSAQPSVSGSGHKVTPLAGVWIEILHIPGIPCPPSVTPLAGVWIEMLNFLFCDIVCRSLPLRECGLKFVIPAVKFRRCRHSPCGSVD